MSNTDSRRSYSNETLPGGKGAVEGIGGGEFEEGVLCRQTHATGLSESSQKTITLLKSTFKLEQFSIIPRTQHFKDAEHRQSILNPADRAFLN